MFIGTKQKNCSLKAFLKDNGLFYGIYLLVVLIVSYYLLNYDKVTIHHAINQLVGVKWIDNAYKYFTHIGDGITAVIIGVVLLFKNIRNGLFVLLSYALAGGTAAIIKNSINYTRPHHMFVYYQKHIKLNLIDGVEVLGENSFPSGHTTTAFALFTSLALIVKSRVLKIIFLILALNAGYSRMHLSQHWLVDVTAGSLIGVTYATLLYFVFYHRPSVHAKFNHPLRKTNP